MRILALLAALTPLLLAGAAWPATLRPMTTLAAATVRLADLWDGVGPEGERVLGPGPAPGGRIVVEAAQLAAIARQFGVDWRPSGNERAVLERPGRLLPREEVLDRLREALAGVGAPADGEIELPGFAGPLVPADTPVEVRIEQLEYEGASGRFAAVVSVAGDGMLTLRQRLAGTLHEVAEVPVLAHRLAPGRIIAPADLRLARVRVAHLRGEVARAPEQAVGLTLRRPLAPGQALALADLVRAIAVARGARVAMQLTAPGLSVSAIGRALEDGAVGERIQVLNPSSRAVVEGVVTGRDRVRIAAGSAPLATPAGPHLALAPHHPTPRPQPIPR